MCTQSCCFIIPPHILRGVERNSENEESRRLAFQTLLESESIRGQRAVNAELWVAAPADGLRRSIYDGKTGYDLPGTLARSEDQPSVTDPDVNSVYDGFEATYDLLFDNFRRKSIDDDYMRLEGTVHHRPKFVNAFWNGRQMVFGDGDGYLFGSFTNSLDVIGHELAHGVVEYTANLRYYGQPGALNESFADVIGSLVRQKLANERANEADWTIGRDLMIGPVKGMALRSLKDPGSAYDHKELGGRDPQPNHMSGYKQVDFDNGGVHIYSGIPNRAFYLAATALGGYAWDIAGQVWYLALRDHLRANATFGDAAAATVLAATLHFGKDEARVVADAWQAVGIAAPLPPITA